MTGPSTSMDPVRLYVGAEPDVAEAMRLARGLAVAIGFNPIQVSYVATVATELASNLCIHAGGGVFEARVQGGGCGIELEAWDHGPGISDIARAMEDGYSTAGGLGCGLPGVQRLMDEMEIASDAQHGTRVRARKWK